ncbi:MAG: hypothetical protein EXQ94_14600 [Alphaproteobacteria bacterium]|nr:hypothetical protein [Alphaproteobacteria bacterium]
MAEPWRALAALRNLGPVTARRLVAIGIADAATLRRLGAAACYARLKHALPPRDQPERPLRHRRRAAGRALGPPAREDIKAALRAEVAGRPGLD